MTGDGTHAYNSQSPPGHDVDVVVRLPYQIKPRLVALTGQQLQGNADHQATHRRGAGRRGNGALKYVSVLVVVLAALSCTSTPAPKQTATMPTSTPLPTPTVSSSPYPTLPVLLTPTPTATPTPTSTPTPAPTATPTPTSTPTPTLTPTPTPIPAVTVTLNRDGELIIHGQGSARYAAQLPAADYDVAFGLWDTDGALQAEHASVKVGQRTVFSGTKRLFREEIGLRVDTGSINTEINIQVGPDDAWFVFLQGLGLSQDLVLTRDPLAPPYAPAGDIGYTDGGRSLAFLYSEDPMAVVQIRNLPWAADGIEEMPSPEHEAIYYLVGALRVDRTVFHELLRQGWLLDGSVTWGEAHSIGDIVYLAQSAPSTAVQLLSMPFMQSFEAMDFYALRALDDLARDGLLEDLLAHPTLRGGITDEHTDLISLYGAVQSDYADLASQLLDEQQTVVVRRTVHLPLQGPTSFSVVWPKDASPGDEEIVEKASASMDLLVDTVRTLEQFMGVPSPRGAWPVLVADVLWPRADHIQIQLDPSRHDDPLLAAHQAARAYWRSVQFSQDWIIKGSMTFMQDYYLSARAGKPLPRFYGCDQFTNIAVLAAFNAPPTHICNYQLGAGLFLDLYNTLGEQTFREAYSRLYTWLADDALRVRCGTEPPRGHCYVHASFVEYLPEHANLTAPILEKHYYGR